jgi:glutathione synthase/RimK-type ligase-like ATP-grasp enzyme
MQREIVACIEGLADSFPGICLSKPYILRQADNKIYQLAMASKLGFTIPESLITNNSALAQEFCSAKPSIIKPISIGKIYDKDDTIVFQTNQVDDNKSIKNLEYCPSYFQEKCEKDYELRVTVVGKKVFAVRIDSQLHEETRTDWRINPDLLGYSETQISKDLEYKCFALLAALRLDFGAFDFIVRDNQYIFLEVNANGQWGWLEGKLGIKISEAIIDYLMGVNQ